MCSIKGFRVLNLWFRGSRFLGLVNPAPSQGVGAEALMTACARELRCLSRSLCTRNTKSDTGPGAAESPVERAWVLGFR